MLGRDGLIVIDGSELSGANTSIAEDVIAKGMSPEQFFELAFSRVSEFLYGLEVPPSSPMLNFGFQDLYNFRQLLEQDPQRLLQDYINVLSERLKASPLVVTILDGSMIYKYLENEEDYASLVDELFTQLDSDREDLVKKTHMSAAILFFGFKIHISRSFADSPMIDDLMKKHGVDEGDEKLDKQQFSELLKPILQDIADTLALNHVTVETTFTLSNGGITKQLLEEEMFLDVFRNVLYQQSSSSEEDESFADVVNTFFERNTSATYGIPPYDADDEFVVLLYDSVFSDNDFKKKAMDLNKDEVGDLAKKVLEKFAQELEANPLFY
ncbi:unnamed protein product [Amaranthus hypochondriacus]